jgi:Lon protease-like protein
MRERSPASKTIRLPESLPIFPLTGVLLLPRGRLPLNIFEPRYLAMTDDALASHRMIGMVQPSAPGIDGQPPTIFQTGCAGRITSFAEEGARYLITLTGVCRFKVASEIATVRGYRRIAADWSDFEGDFIEEEDVVDRARLLEGLKAYFKRHGISTDWKSIESTPDERLVTSLAMICPFNPIEKQTLLEARDLTERAKILIGLVEMAMFDKGDDARH